MGKIDTKEAVLFLDLIMINGHKEICNGFVSAMNSIVNTVSISTEGYIDFKPRNRHLNINYQYEKVPAEDPIHTRINLIKNIKRSLKYIRGRRFKAVVVLSYESMTFQLFYKQIRKLGPVFLFHNHQLDELTKSRLKEWVFNQFKNKVYHVLVDDTLVDAVSKRFEISKESIFVMTAPMVLPDVDSNVQVNTLQKKDTKSILAISNSNDEIQIDKLIDYEMKSHSFENSGFSVIIRRRTLVDSGVSSIKIMSGFISEDQYNQLISDADYILMPYPSDFVYRASGVMVDAFASGKKVIISRFPESVEYEKKYPSYIRTYGDISEIAEIVKNWNEQLSEDERVEFMKTHDAKYRQLCAQKMIDKV